MRSVLYVTLAMALAITSVGCARSQKKVMAELKSDSSIDCTTADGDVRLLQHEKANVAERIAEGVTMIYPAGLVIGVVTRTEKTKYQVAVGDYNEAIDKRIAEIKEQCGIEQSARSRSDSSH